MPRGATCSLISKAITIVGGSTPLSAISPRSRQTGNPHNPVSTVPGEGQRRHAERIAHDAHRPDIPMIFDQAEPHLGGSEKIAIVFFLMSRSMGSRSFLRRKLGKSSSRAGSGGAALAALGCGAVPACPPAVRLRQMGRI